MEYYYIIPLSPHFHCYLEDLFYVTLSCCRDMKPMITGGGGRVTISGIPPIEVFTQMGRQSLVPAFASRDRPYIPLPKL